MNRYLLGLVSLLFFFTASAQIPDYGIRGVRIGSNPSTARPDSLVLLGQNRDAASATYGLGKWHGFFLYADGDSLCIRVGGDTVCIDGAITTPGAASLDTSIIIVDDYTELKSYITRANFAFVTDSLWGGYFYNDPTVGTPDSALIVDGAGSREWVRIVEENKYWLTWWIQNDTSWSDEIQRAIDTISARHERYGDGTLYIPDIGEPYYLDTVGVDPYDPPATGDKYYCVELKSNIAIEMDAGSTLIMSDSMVTFSPDSVDRVNIFIGDSIQNVSITGGIIDGNADGQFQQVSPGWTGCGYYSQGHGNAIHITQVNYDPGEDFWNKFIKISGVTFRNHSGNPIKAYGLDSCALTNLTYSGFGEGIELIWNKNTDIKGIKGIFTTDPCGDGFELSHCDQLRVSDIEITGTGSGAAIDLYGVTNTVVEKFYVHDYSSSGITVQTVEPDGRQSNDIIIRDGRIQSLSGDGIATQGDTMGIITIQNVVIDSCQRGIYINANRSYPQVANINIADCIVRYCDLEGFFSEAAKSIRIQGGVYSHNEKGIAWSPQGDSPASYGDNYLEIHDAICTDNSEYGLIIQFTAGSFGPVGIANVYAVNNGTQDVSCAFPDTTLFTITNDKPFVNNAGSTTINAEGVKVIFQGLNINTLFNGSHGQEVVIYCTNPANIDVQDKDIAGGTANIETGSASILLNENHTMRLIYNAIDELWYPMHPPRNGTMSTWRLATSHTASEEVITDNELVVINGDANILVTRSASTVQLTPVPDGDGSDTNELQTLANTSDATSHTVTLSDAGGSVQLVEGDFINMATTGDTDDGIVTISGDTTGFYALYAEDNGALTGNLDTIFHTSSSGNIDTVVVMASGTSDHDFYEVGGTSPPNNIGDNIFKSPGTTHFGGTGAAAQTVQITGTARITASDGTATTIMGRDADGDVSAVTVGAAFTMAANTLNWNGLLINGDAGSVTLNSTGTLAGGLGLASSGTGTTMTVNMNIGELDTEAAPEGDEMIVIYDANDSPTHEQIEADEFVQDTYGAAVSGNTETGIAVTYDDTDGTLDFVATDASTTNELLEVEKNNVSVQTANLRLDFTSGFGVTSGGAGEVDIEHAFNEFGTDATPEGDEFVILYDVSGADEEKIDIDDLATYIGGGSSGWTDDGTTVRLTTSTDQVGIGTASAVAGVELTVHSSAAGADANVVIRTNNTDNADEAILSFIEDATTEGQIIVEDGAGRSTDANMTINVGGQEGVFIEYDAAWTGSDARTSMRGGIQTSNWIEITGSTTVDEGHYGLWVTASATITFPQVTLTNSNWLGSQYKIVNDSGGNITLDAGTGSSDDRFVGGGVEAETITLPDNSSIIIELITTTSGATAKWMAVQY